MINLDINHLWSAVAKTKQISVTLGIDVIEALERYVKDRSSQLRVSRSQLVDHIIRIHLRQGMGGMFQLDLEFPIQDGM